MAKSTPKDLAETRDVLLVFPGEAHVGGRERVTLQGGGPLDGVWLVSAPLPLTLSAHGSIYDLSDRAAGVYNVHVK